LSFIQTVHNEPIAPFAGPLEHFQAELQRLDLLLHREILRLRAHYQLSLDEFRGLYISDEQVDRLVQKSQAGAKNEDAVAALTARAEVLREENRRRVPPELPWRRLADSFDLSAIEQDLLMLALAPEVDLKYETLYAYLNNDVTRKRPTCELALRVLAFSTSERIEQRPTLYPQGKLFREGILRLIPAGAERPVWLASAIAAAPTVLNFLLEQPAVDHQLAPFVELHVSRRSWRDVPVRESVTESLHRLARYLKQPAEPAVSPFLAFVGREGAGRRAAAEALAHDLDCPLLLVNADTLRIAGESLDKHASNLLLHQRLYRALTYVAPGEALFDKEGSPLPETGAWFARLRRATLPVIVAFEPGARWRELTKGRGVIAVKFPDLPAAGRRALWEAAAAAAGCEIGDETLHSVADRFQLTPRQIDEAVAAVRRYRIGDASLQSGDKPAAIWFDAARSQSDQTLGELAAKIETRHRWDDLVLPAPILQHLQQITAAIRCRGVVYDEWGFDNRVATGKGLKLLFSGPSGTGKTMTAGIMARELELDLYRIDLSFVVSKYIGETEKNLDRIFRAADCSNAVLFFDEADALFGKRSEVKDAHDRYANIEVAYLLQKLEEHDGAVILATNLSKNIDEAFARRMQYVVRFPLPGAAERERIWRGMFPPAAPVDAALDFAFVATQFAFTGGDIKNIALDAAFRAAADQGIITMAHLLRAIAQHLVKEGRAPSVAEFRHYYEFLAQDD
jgi:AAA+ superfamily predicted ATPase